MIISVDFDNTIADYADVFRCAARERGLIGVDFVGSRAELRESVQAVGGEAEWMKLQGYVYGAGIGGAKPSVGFTDFAGRARQRGDVVMIVSHKTQFGHYDPQRVDLREAALVWMRQNSFFDRAAASIEQSNVYFESTLDEKIARIARIAPAVHIDDLAVVFSTPAFPTGIHRILFGAPPPANGTSDDLICCLDWSDVEREIASVART